tara:strand:- start:915 stop:1193 length:279 start_codon:yes stop_codon:yes gene_type:complete
MIPRYKPIKWSFTPEQVFCRISNQLHNKIWKVARRLELCRRCGERVDTHVSSSPELPLHHKRFLAWERHCMCLSCSRREEKIRATIKESWEQ